MSIRKGYLHFDEIPTLREYSNPLVDGVAIDGQMRAFSESFAAPGSVLQAADGSHLVQYLFLDDAAPVTIQPLELPFSMLCRNETQFFRLRSYAQSGRIVSFFFGWPHVETWLLAVNPTGTVWRSSRRNAWNGTTITHATHPPQAYLDGVEQTIVTSGTPTAGQVKVLTSQPSGQGYFDVTTPDVEGSELLQLLYWPEYLVRFEDPRFDVQAANALVMHATLRELVPAKPAS